MSAPRVLVIGVGNTLMQDDGVGVWAVRAFAQAYELPPHVRLIDGGVVGLGLLPELSSAEHLLMIDAVEGKGPPGTLYHLVPEDLPARRGPSLSAHEVGVSEVLSVARLLGRLPRTRILGVQPLETQAIGLDLTPPLREALPRVVAAAAEELGALGVEIKKKGVQP